MSLEMNSRLRTLAAASVVAMMAFCAPSALAATVDLTSGGDATGHNNHTGTFLSGGIAGTITAGCDFVTSNGVDTDCDLSSSSDTPRIRISNDGMGVKSDHNTSDSELDSANSGEFLTFVFNTAVNLLNIDFSSLGGSDRYSLIINGLVHAVNQSADPWTTDIANVSSFSVISTSGKFYVKNFEATTYVGAVPAVPLPAALPLLAAGLGALGFAGARRKRKAAPSA